MLAPPKSVTTLETETSEGRIRNIGLLSINPAIIFSFSSGYQDQLLREALTKR